jgi:pimeloyl-ACP methyl ester carboxylesterase
MEDFRISVPQTELDDLYRRLRATRYTTAAPGEAWKAGVPPEYLAELVGYWLDHYDWSAQERRLNAYPQFLADIGGQSVHFVHRRSENAEAIPIILSHGWPYTFVEMLPLLDELGDFHVVVPSLPGYGWSALPADGPVTGPTMAEPLHQLMRDLGYDRYLTYGEDVGSGLSDWLAALHPEAVIGIHAPHAAFPPVSRRTDLAPVESEFFEWLDGVWAKGSGYSDMQSTRPDTLAAGLSDSPAGLAAWIVEKFREWSDCGGDVERSFSRDQLLTTVMIYWITGTIGSSFRAYYDAESDPPLPLITVPAAVVVQRHESRYPRELAERTYTDLRSFQLLPRGGHFTAAEAPDLIAADIRSFARSLGTIAE